MIEITCNDRLGKKVRVKCNPDDTIGDVKKLIAAQTGTKWDKIVLKKWYTIFKDHISLEDYEIHDGMNLELYYHPSSDITAQYIMMWAGSWLRVRCAPHKTPSADKERLEELFQQLDVNKDGRIDMSEIQRGLHEKGIHDPEEARRVVQQGDTNQDGLMNFAEFLQYCTEKEKKLWLVFEKLDLNKDGEIDSDEIKQTMKKMGVEANDSEVNKLLEKMDKDGNIRISWEEWRDYLLLQPHTSVKSIFQIWKHASFSNIGEASDTVLLSDDFSEEEKVSGIWWRQLVAGAGAGAVSRTATAPLDRLKIFFQVQSMHGQQFTLGSCLRQMVKEGGLWSLWRGNGINVIKIAPESALRFYAYEKMKSYLKRGDEDLGVRDRLIAGSSAGVIAQTAIYPMEVLKTRLALGKTGQYRGVADCCKQIVRQEGLRAFYKGLTPSLVGIIPYAGIDLAIYETLKMVMLKHYDTQGSSVVVPLACGIVSSTCGQLASYPLSLCRTRLQAQTGSEKKVMGMSETLTTILKEEGLKGLYRGLLPNFLKVLPAVSIGYVVYEHLKRLLGVPTVS